MAQPRKPRTPYLQVLGLRPAFMRLTPYTAGEKDFLAWIDILEQNYGTYEELRRMGQQDRSRRFIDKEKRFRKDRAEGKKGNPANYNIGQGNLGIAGDECQSEEGLPESIREGRLRGYVRAVAFPDTKKGKRDANKYADRLGTEYEGSLLIQVRRGFCRDSRQNIWGVWVKPSPIYTPKGSDDNTQFVKSAPHKNARGGRVMAAQGARMWSEYRGASKKAVRCPKCEAPKDFPCVNDKGIESGVYMKDDKPIPTKTADETMRTSRGYIEEIRSVRTNAHRERVDAYLATQGKEMTSRDFSPQDKVELMPPTDRQKVRWWMQKMNESQIDKYEEAEDAGGFDGYDDELDYILRNIANKKQKVKFDQYVEKGVPNEE